MMRGLCIKDDELKRFAEIIMTSDTRRQMLQRINGFRVGLMNRHGVSDKRVLLLGELVKAYK
jgi:hypothetical protein